MSWACSAHAHRHGAFEHVFSGYALPERVALTVLGHGQIGSLARPLHKGCSCCSSRNSHLHRGRALQQASVHLVIRDGQGHIVLHLKLWCGSMGYQHAFTLGWGSLAMTSMRVVMEAFPVSGVYTGKIADHRGCIAFPSALAMACIDEQHSKTCLARLASGADSTSGDVRGTQRCFPT